MNKSPGQLAYEQDLIALATYADGTHRRTWDQQIDSVKLSWERKPFPRVHANASKGQ